MEADRFSVRVREHDGTYLGAIFGDRDTLMDDTPCPGCDSTGWARIYDGVYLTATCSVCHGSRRDNRRALIAAALASHDARVTA
jgi:mono/diheme cytochrome c family protein